MTDLQTTVRLPRLLLIANCWAAFISCAALAVTPINACATSGELLFEQLRQQVDRQRQEGSEDFLHWSGETAKGFMPSPRDALIECTPEALSRVRANDPALERFEGYYYNATYSWVTIPIEGRKYTVCVYLTRPIKRSLTAEEAHDLVVVAGHLEFPQYNPPASDLQIAEEKFQTLRSKARAARAAMTPAQRAKIQEQLDGLVECSDKELLDGGIWRELGPGGDVEDIDSVSYVWNWAHSIDGDPCVYVRSPLHRPLSLDEAQDLLTLTHVELPSMHDTLPISDAGARRNAGIKIEGEGGSNSQRK
jgi:hypothetical protein